LADFKVMIVDDDPVTGKMIQMALCKVISRISYFSNPIEALLDLKESPPQVLILDWNLPGMRGDELTIKLSEWNLMNSIDIFLITADNLDQNDEYGLSSLGIVEFFYKPIDMPALVSAVHGVLLEHAQG
jgi:CheY-like chemotaxis protein